MLTKEAAEPDTVSAAFRFMCTMWQKGALSQKRLAAGGEPWEESSLVEKERGTEMEIKVILPPKLKRGLLMAALAASVYVGFKYILPLFLPFLAAYLTALFLRPSCAFLERRLQFTVRGKRAGIPIGVIGAAELAVLSLFLGMVMIYGGRRLLLEANQLILAVPEWIRHLEEEVTGMCRWVEQVCRMPEGMLMHAIRDMAFGAAETVKSAVMPRLVVNSVSAVAFLIKAVVLTAIFCIAVILSLQEMDELRRRRHHSVFHREFFLLGRRMAMTGSAWLKTQAVICWMTACLCILGLFLIGNPYCILGGIAIGLLDSLPILGAGTVLIPWGVILLFQKKWLAGGILLALYVACYFLREFTEARLMGKKMGLSPLETIVSMYVGLKLFGFLGFILGPIGLLMIRDLMEEYDPCRIQAAMDVGTEK